jgi:hypothetical protein
MTKTTERFSVPEERAAGSVVEGDFQACSSGILAAHGDGFSFWVPRTQSKETLHSAWKLNGTGQGFDDL